MGSVGHKISMELDVDYTNTKSELGISKYMYYNFFIIQLFASTTEVKKNYIKYSSKSHGHKCYFGIHIYVCTNAIIYIRCIVTDRVYPKLDCIQNIPKNEFYGG